MINSGLSTELEKTIDNKANTLANYWENSYRIKYEEAKERLVNWCNNFIPFLNNQAILIPLIKEILFISDHDIIERCKIFFEEKLFNNQERYYFTSIGAGTESSFRIVSNLNSNKHYTPNLKSLLANIEEDTEPVSILFIDDFINSGGQIETIISKWFSSDVGKESRYDQRECLNVKEQSTLRNVKLYFVFYYGMANGISRINTLGKKYSLNIEAYSINQYDDQVGLFGDKNDQSLIESKSENKLSSKSIFEGYIAKDISPLYKICYQAGYALNKLNKPNWNESKCKKRILGYGNSSQLFITEHNVPTCTLTCLWQSGKIQINGQDIYWKSLLNRREKLIGGSEGDITNTENIHYIGLDNNSHRATPFEIMITDYMSIDNMKIDQQYWDIATKRFSGFFVDDMNSFFFESKNKKEPVIQHFTYNSQHLGILHNNPTIEINKETYRIKIKSFELTILPGKILFFGARIQFKDNDISLKEASNIIYNLRLPNKSNIKDVVSKVLIHGGIPFNSTPNKFKIMTFIRDNNALFSTAVNLKETILDSFSNFNKLTNMTPKKTNINTISFKTNGDIAATKDGVCLLCGTEHPGNFSDLQNTFFTGYYLLYLISQWVEIIKIKKSIGITSIELDKTYKALSNLGNVSWSNLLIANKFAKLLRNINTL